YKRTPLHTIEPGIQVRGGDVINRDGTGGHSIYGPLFPDESLKLRHLSEGVISMANAGPDSNQSQFVITLAPTPWMDGSHVVFGTVLEGMQTLHRVAREYGLDSKADKAVTISDCGVITAHASAAEEESIERSTPAMVMDLIHEDIKEIRKAKAA
ncbi:cyclophilin-like domain-containing protein, partial [Tribonema minus]